MMRIVCFIALLMAGASSGLRAEEKSTPKPTDWDLSAFPMFTGKVVQVLGHQNSYVPPNVGATFHFDFSQPSKVGTLRFGGDTYIAMPSGQNGNIPFAVESLKTYGNGAFKNMRLVSRSDFGLSEIVKMDVNWLPGRGDPNFVQLWIVEEYDGVTQGVILVEGKANKPVPKPVPLKETAEKTFDGKDPIESALAYLRKQKTDLSKHDTEKATASKYCPPQSTVYQWAVHIPAKAGSKAESLWIALPEKGEPWRLDPKTLERLQ